MSDAVFGLELPTISKPRTGVRPAGAVARAGDFRFRTATEARMLSPHEFATLLLVKHAPEATDLDRSELKSLLEHRLVALEQTVNGIALPMLTPGGQSLLRAMASLTAHDALRPDETRPGEAR
jgi:hypothetical protein